MFVEYIAAKLLSGTLSHLIFSTTLGYRYYDSHFTDRKSQALEIGDFLKITQLVRAPVLRSYTVTATGQMPS